VLLRANTGPVDALVYAFVLCWVVFLAFTPDGMYAHTSVDIVLTYKGVWIWPATFAMLVTPLGWMSGRPWVHHSARAVAVAWWVYIGAATAIVAPAIIVLWAQSLCCFAAAIWLLAREGANDVVVAPPVGK
jgi:hypothetical protein